MTGKQKEKIKFYDYPQRIVFHNAVYTGQLPSTIRTLNFHKEIQKFRGYSAAIMAALLLPNA